MQRLLDDFSASFDLDHRVSGRRLGALLAETIGRLETQLLPEWGQEGNPREILTRETGALRFHYAPHLFPGMDLKLLLAHKLQFHLLPRELPPDAPVEVSAVLESFCHLSGDLLGWKRRGEGSFLIWIVDVAGHGVQSGLASAVVKVLIDRADEDATVSEIAAFLNRELCACSRSEARPTFATGFFLSIGSGGRSEFTSAGHPPALLRRRGGDIELLEPTSRPAGLFADTVYPPVGLPLRFGDTLLLYTDGLAEAANESGEQLGLGSLVDFLRRDFDRPSSLTASLYDMVAEHQDLSSLDDDIAFLAARLV